MKIYILKKTEAWTEGLNKEFTHPWNNTDDSYFDGHHYDGVQDYIDREFNNIPGQEKVYDWVEIDSSRIQRQGIETAIMSIDDETRNESNNYFIKLTSDNEIPLYYYNVEPSEPSNQNNDVITYALKLELDCWSTFGSKYNKFFWDFEHDILFLRKHANRFIFPDESTTGYYFDYLEQDYLTRGQLNGYHLIKDDWEPLLDLDTWKYINSGSNLTQEQWYNQTYSKWAQKPWAAGFYTDSATTDLFDNPVDVTPNTDYWQNNVAYEFNKLSDDRYNSNGLYRWLVIKAGNYISKQTTISQEGNFLSNQQFNLIKEYYRKDTEHDNVIFDASTLNDEQRTFDNFTGTVGTSSHIRLTTSKLFPLSQTITENDKLVFTIDGSWLTNIDSYFSVSGHIIQDPEDEYRAVLNVPSKSEEGQFVALIVASAALWFTALFAILLPIAYITLDNGSSNPWFDNKDQREQIVINASDIMLGKEYTLKEYRTQSTNWKVDGERISFGRINDKPLKVRLTCTYDDTNNNIRFNIIATSYRPQTEGGPDIDQLKTTLINNFTLSNKITIMNTTVSTSAKHNMQMTGDTLLLLPIEKTVPANLFYESQSDGQTFVLPDSKQLSKTVYWLFNSYGVTPGSQSFVGSLINNIPIEILALASRKNANKKDKYTFSMTNIVSTRYGQYQPEGIDAPECPMDIQLLLSAGANASSGQKTKNNYRYKIPCIFTDLSYIPITLAKSPVYGSNKCVGGNKFINTYWDLMTNEDVTSVNTMYSDPVMYSPAIYQWKYLIDGINDITVNGMYINMKALVLIPEWEINLNTCLADRTYFKVDLGILKNINYPFSKNFSELVGFDNRLFTLYTEDYYNWLQNNQSTYQTAKMGFDVNAKREMATSILGGTGQGAAAGAMMGPAAPIGIAVGAITGGALGAIGASIAKKYNKQLFDLEWKNRFNNMQRAPMQNVVSGFSSGSINYALWDKADNSQYNLFRTYLPCLIDRKAIWYDYCWNGYYFNSTAKFKEYDNRRNFNYFSCNFEPISSLVNKFLKDKMSKESLLFAQQNWIDWFIHKITSGIRLYKCDFTDTYNEEWQMSDIVLGNIENDYRKPWNPYHVNTILEVNNEDKRIGSIEPNSSVNYEKLDQGINTWDEFIKINDEQISIEKIDTEDDHFIRISNENEIFTQDFNYTDYSVENQEEFRKVYNSLQFNFNTTKYELTNTFRKEINDIQIKNNLGFNNSETKIFNNEFTLFSMGPTTGELHSSTYGSLRGRLINDNPNNITVCESNWKPQRNEWYFREYGYYESEYRMREEYVLFENEYDNRREIRQLRVKLSLNNITPLNESEYKTSFGNINIDRLFTVTEEQNATFSRHLHSEWPTSSYTDADFILTLSMRYDETTNKQILKGTVRFINGHYYSPNIFEPRVHLIEIRGNSSIQITQSAYDIPMNSMEIKYKTTLTFNENSFNITVRKENVIDFVNQDVQEDIDDNAYIQLYNSIDEEQRRFIKNEIFNSLWLTYIQNPIISFDKDPRNSIINKQIKKEQPELLKKIILYKQSKK